MGDLSGRTYCLKENVSILPFDNCNDDRFVLSFGTRHWDISKKIKLIADIIKVPKTFDEIWEELDEHSNPFTKNEVEVILSDYFYANGWVENRECTTAANTTTTLWGSFTIIPKGVVKSFSMFKFLLSKTHRIHLASRFSNFMKRRFAVASFNHNHIITHTSICMRLGSGSSYWSNIPMVTYDSDELFTTPHIINYLSARVADKNFNSKENFTLGLSSLKQIGSKIDNFLSIDKDFWLLDYIINALSEDQQSGNVYHVFKTMSLIEMLLINPSNSGRTQGEMERKLPQFLSDRIDSSKKRFMQNI